MNEYDYRLFKNTLIDGGLDEQEEGFLIGLCTAYLNHLDVSHLSLRPAYQICAKHQGLKVKILKWAEVTNKIDSSLLEILELC